MRQEIVLRFPFGCQWCCASHRKISRPSASIFLRADHCHCFIPATLCIRKFFPFRGISQPQARIPAAKLSRSAALEGNLLLRKESTAFHYLESPPAAMVRWGLFFFRATFFFSDRVTFRVTGKGTDSPFSPSSLCLFSTQNYRQ